MTAQVTGSIVVGLFVSAVLFLPLLVFQYRRFDSLRTLWTTAGFVYATSIVAFTVFPLPDFDEGYCAAHATEPLLDPLRFPRELIELVSTKGITAVASDWLIWEIALNMVLFIPFGLIAGRVLEWPRAAVMTAALATSLLIELTQYTGNWGLAPCPYRFADTTDLLTNSLGALIGIGLEKISPRLLSTKADLLARKDSARPVTRARRLAGMLLDAWYLSLATLIGWMGALGLYILTQSGTDGAITREQMVGLQQSMLFTGWLCAMTVLLLPALTGNGASYGQRAVYLTPEPKNGTRRGGRWRALARALVVQGVVLTGFIPGSPTVLLTPLWTAAAIASLIASARGLSCALTGCTMTDARTGRTKVEVQA